MLRALPAAGGDKRAKNLLSCDFGAHNGWARYSVNLLRVPKSWRVLYRDADGQFQPVKSRGPYATEKDTFNKVEFAPVTTAAINLEIEPEDKWSAGIQEVVVE